MPELNDDDDDDDQNRKIPENKKKTDCMNNCINTRNLNNLSRHFK